MPWVRFTSAFDWKPTRQVTMAYRAGDEVLVTTPCANAAMKAGKAERLTKKKAKANG